MMSGSNYRESYRMAAKCIECDNLADQHGLCHMCRRWYKKRLENIRLDTFWKVVEMAEENEEEEFYVHCRKCGDEFFTGTGAEGKKTKRDLEQVDQEPLKGRSLFTCRACIYSWL